MGALTANKLSDLKAAAINALPIEEKDKHEIMQMEFGFLVMHCVAATAASKWWEIWNISVICRYLTVSPEIVVLTV